MRLEVGVDLSKAPPKMLPPALSGTAAATAAGTAADPAGGMLTPAVAQALAGKLGEELARDISAAINAPDRVVFRWAYGMGDTAMVVLDVLSTGPAVSRRIPPYLAVSHRIPQLICTCTSG